MPTRTISLSMLLVALLCGMPATGAERPFVILSPTVELSAEQLSELRKIESDPKTHAVEIIRLKTQTTKEALAWRPGFDVHPLGAGLFALVLLTPTPEKPPPNMALVATGQANPVPSSNTKSNLKMTTNAATACPATPTNRSMSACEISEHMKGPPTVIDIAILLTNKTADRLRKVHGTYEDGTIALRAALKGRTDALFKNSKINATAKIVRIGILKVKNSKKTIEEEISAFKHKPCEIVRYLPTSPYEAPKSAREFRVTYKADVVILIADIALPESEEKPGDFPVGGCWVGSTGPINTTNFQHRKDLGFAIVDYQLALKVGFWTFSHELGHILGANHLVETDCKGINCASLKAQRAPANAHFNKSMKFRTIMAYPDPCPDCLKLNEFSHPWQCTSYKARFPKSKQIPAQCGVQDLEDNATIVRRNVAQVASFSDHLNKE